jgi:metallo-beta-lactamase family protein
MDLLIAGAAGTVTGSKYVLHAGDSRVLVDCGLFQGVKQLRLLNWQGLGFDARKIDAAVLSHAHIDHSGALPLLYAAGYRGVVHATPASIDLCGILLPDSGYLQEQEAAFLNRHGLSRHHPAKPLYTRADAEAVLDHFRPLAFDTPRRVAPGVTARLNYGGHILGAGSVLLRAAGRSILFSGDLGRPRDPVMRPPDPPPPADWIVVESTYGDREHPTTNPEDVLADIISRTAAHGGTVVIPAFAVGRAQMILYYLYQLKMHRRIPDIPVFLDSPMAVSASDILCRHRDLHRLGQRRVTAVCNVARYVREVAESKALDRNGYPKVIISASGMATGGRVLHHLEVYLTDQRNAVVFTGFQAAGTRGAHLVAGARTVKIHGEHVRVRAQVHNLDMLSAHAGASEIIAWLSRAHRRPRGVIITHGEPAAADALRLRIKDELGWDCRVPFLGESIALDGDRFAGRRKGTRGASRK